MDAYIINQIQIPEHIHTSLDKRIYIRSILITKSDDELTHLTKELKIQLQQLDNIQKYLEPTTKWTDCFKIYPDPDDICKMKINIIEWLQYLA